MGLHVDTGRVTDAVVVFRNSAERNRNYTIGAYIRADYNYLAILGQKWRALRNHLALKNRQNLVLGNINPVSLTIGRILETAAENTGRLFRSRMPNSGSGRRTEELVVLTHRKSMFVLSLPGRGRRDY